MAGGTMAEAVIPTTLAAGWACLSWLPGHAAKGLAYASSQAITRGCLDARIDAFT